MGRRPLQRPLSVFINGRLVGRLRRQTTGAVDFQYDPAWLEWTPAFPISLSLPLREDRYIGAPVLAVFENLLPDSAPIRRRLAECVGAAGDDAFNLLAAIGRDCVGAIQLLPAGVDPGKAGAVAGRRIGDRQIAARLRDLGRTPLGLAPDDEFRISLAGAQEKTALLLWRRKWHVPQGSAPTTHILKPQIGRLPNGVDLSNSVENEHLCLRLASALGLPSAETEITDFCGVRTLVVTRFDRRWTRDGRLLRLPQEDCCQALSVPPARKYEADGGPGLGKILEFLKGSDDPPADRKFFLKSQVVFWLLGATDGHAKNFSVAIAPGGRFRLTPLYDVMSTQPAVDAGQMRRNRAKLAMAVGTRRHYVIDGIAPRHFIQSAVVAGVPAAAMQAIFAEILERAPHAIGEVRDGLPNDFPAALARSVIGGLEARLRLVERDAS